MNYNNHNKPYSFHTPWLPTPAFVCRHVLLWRPIWQNKNNWVYPTKAAINKINLCQTGPLILYRQTSITLWPRSGMSLCNKKAGMKEWSDNNSGHQLYSPDWSRSLHSAALSEGEIGLWECVCVQCQWSSPQEEESGEEGDPPRWDKPEREAQEPGLL